MDQNKCDAIDVYLQTQFPNSKIEQANITLDQNYSIQTEDDLLLLKVGKNFIEDNSKDEMIKKLERWDVTSFLVENSSLGILVTDSGVRTFQRS